MQCRFHSREQRPPTALRRSRGYVLISLMLFLSLLAVAALAILPSMAFQVKRDREEEMIHRGVAYSRGIRRFYKKFGRYPTRLEELENTNNLRFIRKRYKDPMNVVEGKEQDFKILHMGDVMGLLPAVAQLPGGTAPGAMNGPGGSQNPSGPLQQTAVTAMNNPSGNVATTVTNATSETDSGNPSSQQVNPSTSGFSGPTFGGGPMLGVASGTKKQSIREFCKKNHYNDWKFIYDPSTDLGTASKTPWCPLAAGQGVGKSLNPAGAMQPSTGTQPAPSSPAPNGDTAIQQ